MDYICPGCHTELDPTNTQCPVCLRAVSRHEMMKALQVRRREDEAARKRPKIITATVAVIILCVYGFNQAQKRGVLEKLLNAAHTQSPQVPAVAVQPPPIQAPIPAPSNLPEPPAAMPAPSSSGPGQTPDALPRPPEPEPEPEPSDDWTVHGTVYDLLSLRPCAGARLTFENHASGMIYKAKTDAKGRYTIHMPKLSDTDGGYRVAVSAKGYVGDYLEESSPPFASRNLAHRQEAANEAAQTQVLHVPIFIDQAMELEYNLALLPSQ